MRVACLILCGLSGRAMLRSYLAARWSTHDVAATRSRLILILQPYLGFSFVARTGGCPCQSKAKQTGHCAFRSQVFPEPPDAEPCEAIGHIGRLLPTN